MFDSGDLVCVNYSDGPLVGFVSEIIDRQMEHGTRREYYVTNGDNRRFIGPDCVNRHGMILILKKKQITEVLKK